MGKNIPTDPAEAEQQRIAELVRNAVTLNTKIDLYKGRLDALKDELRNLGAGKYLSYAGDKVTVTPAATAIKPDEAQIAAARALAKGNAHLLFREVTSYKCVDGFRQIVAALFTPARAAKILSLCEVPTPAQVRF